MDTFQRLISLEGKVAVITGGAGHIGYATAIRLAKCGARVVLLARCKIDQVKIDDLPNPHLKHFAVVASITDTSALKLVAQQVKDVAGRCDILINCAGISQKRSAIKNMTDEMFDEVILTNIRGTFAATREFVDLLQASGDGLVVNISSAATRRAGVGNIAYSASKAGVDMMTATLGKMLAPTVRVIGISPSQLENTTSGAGVVSAQPEAFPLGRLVRADDIASTVEACATMIRYATGTTILVDGGRTI